MGKFLIILALLFSISCGDSATDEAETNQSSNAGQDDGSKDKTGEDTKKDDDSKKDSENSDENKSDDQDKTGLDDKTDKSDENKAEEKNLFSVNSCKDVKAGSCEEIKTSKELLELANLLSDDTTIILPEAKLELENAVTIRAKGISVIGQGIDKSVLSFTGAKTQFNGIDVVGDKFLVQDLTVLDAPKDGIRVEQSDGVIFRRIKATWTDELEETNGAYGIYPVKSKNVLVEDSFAENASDAGLYVGQCEYTIVRNNTVKGNVAGLEIENTQYADVYGNLAEGNTAGILVFDLPGNPIVGRDVRIYKNTIKENNLPNFAPGGTVSVIPPGTGTIIMATRRVEVTDNTYEKNKTTDIALVSGLAIEGKASKWNIKKADMLGKYDDLGLLPGTETDTFSNHRLENIVIANNSHSGSGYKPSAWKDIGTAVAFFYGSVTVDNVLYGGIGESVFDVSDNSKNSNDNHICVGDNISGTLGLLNLGGITDVTKLNGHPHTKGINSPFGPFDCKTLKGDAIKEVVLP